MGAPTTTQTLADLAEQTAERLASRYRKVEPPGPVGPAGPELDPSRMFLDWSPVPNTVVFVAGKFDGLIVRYAFKPEDYDLQYGPPPPGGCPQVVEIKLREVRALSRTPGDQGWHVRTYGWHAPTRTLFTTPGFVRETGQRTHMDDPDYSMREYFRSVQERLRLLKEQQDRQAPPPQSPFTPMNDLERIFRRKQESDMGRLLREGAGHPFNPFLRGVYGGS